MSPLPLLQNTYLNILSMNRQDSLLLKTCGIFQVTLGNPHIEKLPSVQEIDTWKGLSHQIRFAWKIFSWIGVGEDVPHWTVKIFKILTAIWSSQAIHSKCLQIPFFIGCRIALPLVAFYLPLSILCPPIVVWSSSICQRMMGNAVIYHLIRIKAAPTTTGTVPDGKIRAC